MFDMQARRDSQTPQYRWVCGSREDPFSCFLRSLTRAAFSGSAREYIRLKVLSSYQEALLRDSGYLLENTFREENGERDGTYL